MAGSAQHLLDVSENCVHPGCSRLARPLPTAVFPQDLSPESHYRDVALRKSVDDRQLHAHRMSLPGWSSTAASRGGLCRSPATALATEAAVIGLKPAGEQRLAVSLHHRMHHVAWWVMPGWRCSLIAGTPSPAPGHDMDGPEPHGERQSGGNRRWCPRRSRSGGDSDCISAGRLASTGHGRCEGSSDFKREMNAERR